MKFKKNIHPYERALRITLGVAITSAAFIGGGNPWYFLGIIPLLTGLAGWCPPYALLGINTCGRSRGNRTPSAI